MFQVEAEGFLKALGNSLATGMLLKIKVPGQRDDQFLVGRQVPSHFDRKRMLLETLALEAWLQKLDFHGGTRLTVPARPAEGKQALAIVNRRSINCARDITKPASNVNLASSDNLKHV